MTPNIIIAEDDDEVRSLIEENLDAEFGQEYGIVTTEDGEEAWDRITEGDDPAELVVLDVMMPNTDGFSILERIRQNDDLDGVGVIMLTSRSREEDITRAIEGGADDFVAKPFSSDDLLDSINQFLS